MFISRRTLLRGAGTFAGAAMLPVGWGALAATPPSNLKVAEALANAVSLLDFEVIAQKHIDPTSFAYVRGAAGDEITYRANRAAYDQIRLHPRVLVDVSNVDTKVSLFGQELAHPILLAPTGLHKEMHPDGELATIEGAGNADAAMVISTYANTAVQDIAKAATKPVWFQLYMQKDKGFTKELVRRAEDCGCAAICLTVDTPVLGARDRQNRAKFRPKHGIPNLWGYQIKRSAQELRDGSIYHPLLLSNLTWRDVEWLVSFARVPILLKGILGSQDAETAISTGVAGIVVSNHGARNLDTLPATIDALARVAEKVGGRVPILVDGGIRRGTDVLKAIAFGANAVLVGRPYLYGLGLGGANGVTKSIDILHREFKMAMALTGRTSIGDIDRTVIW